MNTLSNSHHQTFGVDKLPIHINGFEKYATGLTKRTTVDDVKFAMLSVSDSKFNPSMLEEFGIFESWQGNERLLDGKIKIYKLIRLWQSLPGDQLSQVKFMIKKRKPQSHQHIAQMAKVQKLTCRDANLLEQTNQRTKTPVSKRFAFCTLSPAMQKTWNEEKIKRKSSFIQRQLTKAASQNLTEAGYESSSSVLSSNSAFCSSYETDNSSSDVDDDLNSDKQRQHKRYASIKRFNRSKKSNIKQTQQIKKEFIDLVNKQNEIIDKQLNKITNLESGKKSNKVIDFVEKLRSRSLETRKSKVRSKQNNIHISEQDVSEAFSVENVQEYTQLCKDYFKVEHNLTNKLNKIEKLKIELDEIRSNSTSSNNLNKSIKKTNKKLLNSIDTNKIQTEKLNDLSSALTRIDDVITLKSKFIQSLEDELQRLENESDSGVKEIKIYKEVDLNNNVHSNLTYMPVLDANEQKKSLAYTSTSSTSSSSSVFTSISSISTSQNGNGFNSVNSQCNLNNRSKNFTYVDNESDTGISSANSDDFNSQQLETLV
jgi:hypothetical protein